MKYTVVIALLGGISWIGLWLTPDQQGQRLMDAGEFAEAAETFQEPMRIGVAWFRDGEFEKAEQAFARIASPEAEFNRGNCLIMRGDYEAAIAQFDRALQLRPDWEDAIINRAIAVARAERTKREGGDMGDQKIGADEIVFDRNKKPGGEDTETDAQQPLTDSSMQAMWLRRVQTKPADFLRVKFAYQLADEGGE